MKPEQVKELVANWRERSKVKLNPSHINFDIYDGQRQAFANCADELEAALEQAEREAVGQGGAEFEEWWERHNAELRRGNIWEAKKEGCKAAWEAAPRPEASTQEAAMEKLRQIAQSMEHRVKSHLSRPHFGKPEQIAGWKHLFDIACDRCQIEAVLAEFEKEGK